MTDEPRTELRTPTAGKSGTTRIPTWKFDLLRGHILDVVDEVGPQGALSKEMTDAIRPRLTEDEAERLGKLGWHVMGVKLELEVRGEIERVAKASPQRLRRAGA